MPDSSGAATAETGWLPDFVYTKGAFRAGLAMFAGAGGRITRFSSDPSDLARAERLGNRAMLPGLVNVHSHAFQRAIRGRTEHRTAAQRDTFWTWRESMYRAANRLSPDSIYHVSRMAFLEMVVSGITTVGEFHYLIHGPGGVPYQDRNSLAVQVLRAANEVGMRIDLLRTAYARAGWQKPADPEQARFLTTSAAEFIADTEALRAFISKNFPTERAWIGIAPHSIRAVPLEYLQEIASFARANQLPMHMHVAEQPAEIEACLSEYGLSPVALLYENGILDSRFTAVHAIHVNRREIGYIAEARANVCACPTTERNLGDGISPADEFLAAGVDICLGSDSNVQIDLLEDARALEYHLRLSRLERVVLTNGSEQKDLSTQLFAYMTETGARSVAAPVGSLEPGRLADFFTVDLSDPSIAGADQSALLSNIVLSLERPAIRDIVVGGEFLVRDGRHPLQEDIVRNFQAVQKSIWGSL